MCAVSMCRYKRLLVCAGGKSVAKEQSWDSARARTQDGLMVAARLSAWGTVPECCKEVELIELSRSGGRQHTLIWIGRINAMRGCAVQSPICQLASMIVGRR